MSIRKRILFKLINNKLEKDDLFPFMVIYPDIEVQQI
jgi:hypothetical protein